jgi:hypothetical protein
MPTIIGEPDPEGPEVEIQIQAETTEDTLILPASGPVFGVADVVLALIFLTLGFGAVMLVRTRNHDNSDAGRPDVGSGRWACKRLANPLLQSSVLTPRIETQ